MTPLDPQAFEVLLANCADEPIRFPGAIQPHGLLVTLSEPDLRIQQISTNVHALFGLSAESLLGQPLSALTGDEAAVAVQQASAYPAVSEAPPAASPPVTLHDAQPLVGVDETVGGGQDADMLGNSARGHAEQDERAETGVNRSYLRLHRPGAFG